MSDTLRFGNVEIDLLRRGRELLGIGEIRIGGLAVRSGDLPLRPFAATHDGIQYDRYEIDSVQATSRRVVLRTRALGTIAPVAALLDHSLDPVWSTRPWDGRVVAEDRLEWVFEAAECAIGDRVADGFRYGFRFRSPRRELYFILDRATWELEGDAHGVTLLRQQMGTDPRVTLRARTAYSTSACIGYPINPVMTHDVPRWASEQAFDYQYKRGHALIGLFDRVGLIRSIIARSPGERQIRHFDKHLFDQAATVETVPKFIGLLRDLGDDTAQANGWTRVFDVAQDTALAEFGMRRTASRTTLSHNFWHSFTADSYREDLLPAAAALGFQQLFIDPLWENDMTKARAGQLPAGMGGNMCCPHEYRVAEVLGGVAGYRRLAADARAQGVELISWIGSHQSVLSPYLNAHPAQIIKLADGRHWYGSGYDCIRGMDLTSPFGDMFEAAVLQAHRDTGVAGFLYDSFYNFGWMPVNFHSPDPADAANLHKGALKAHTQWRRLCQMMAAWQKAGLHMLIESLGPWGQPQHGVQGAYHRDGSEVFAYPCALALGYSVIPVPGAAVRGEAPPDFYYRLLANQAPTTLNLWVNGPGGKRLRIDQAASPLIRQGNLDYRAVLPLMHARTILSGDAGVLWAPARGAKRVLFSYRKQLFPAAPGTRCRDCTSGARSVAGARGLAVEAHHTYVLG
jgi:hypothetical protein